MKDTNDKKGPREIKYTAIRKHHRAIEARPKRKQTSSNENTNRMNVANRQSRHLSHLIYDVQPIGLVSY